MILNQYASVTDLRGNVLWVTFGDPGARDNFNKAAGEEHLAQAIQAELGANLQVRARLESEPIPDTGTAIISLAKPVDSGSSPDSGSGPGSDSGSDLQPRTGSRPDPRPASKPAPAPAQSKRQQSIPPVEEDDVPSDDDEVVENPDDQAAELVMELFDAELVKEEQTKPRGRK